MADTQKFQGVKQNQTLTEGYKPVKGKLNRAPNNTSSLHSVNTPKSNTTVQTIKQYK